LEDRIDNHEDTHHKYGMEKREMLTDITISDPAARNPNSGALRTGPNRRQAMTALACGGLALASTKAWAVAGNGISHNAASIHQEAVFKASRQRVYEALVDTAQFDKVIEISGVMKSMHLGAKPTAISREVGGAFTLFGGYITGRQVELVQDVLIVQAWRAGGWDPGIYSIAKFELVEQGSGTKLIFDHTGFPEGEAESLASGWKAHYWDPLDKLLT
jgi:activator of HSP90 ATPase